jgi:hypothetical protein
VEARPAVGEHALSPVHDDEVRDLVVGEYMDRTVNAER